MNENTTYTVETAIPHTRKHTRDTIKNFICDLDDIATIDHTPTHTLITYTCEAKNETKAQHYITHKLNTHNITPDYTDTYTINNPRIWNVTINTSPTAYTRLTTNTAAKTRFTLPIFKKNPTQLTMCIEASTETQACTRITNLMHMLGRTDASAYKAVLAN